jgi:hypothetical protein
MIGELVQFEKHRGFKRGQLYRQHPVPDGRAPDIRGTSTVALRGARITRLVMELEELSRRSKTFPPATLDQARAGLRKTRRIVRPWTAPENDLEGAPQPELDDERIERMYRELNKDV